MSYQEGYLGKVWAISIFYSCPRVFDRYRHWLFKSTTDSEEEKKYKG